MTRAHDVKTVRLKHLAEFQNGFAFKSEDWGDDGVPIIRIQNLNGSRDFNNVRVDVDSRYRVRQGELLYSWSASLGPYVWAERGVYYLNQHIYRVHTLRCNMRWLYWVLVAATRELESFMQGSAMTHVTKKILGNHAVPSADGSLQRRIASFLDRETARIDELVDKKIRLIELLEEKRTAAISHAIRTGSGSGVKMRDSGSPSVGQIPEHWDVLPVWMLFRLGRGRVISHGDIDRNPGSYPVFSSQTSNDGVLGYVDTYDFDGDYLTWTTDGARAGTVFKRSGRFNCTNVCGTLKPVSDDLDLTYFAQAIELTARPFVRVADVNPKLMNNSMASIRVPVPPSDEQRQIGAQLADLTSATETVRRRLTEQLGLLAEYRRALITAAVTGQIDIAAQPSEPEEAIA